jgi:hypothetical protein
VIFEITEMFLFLKRYYERIAPDAVIHAAIELTDMQNRRLEATEWNMIQFLADYTCKEPRVLIESDYMVAELRTSSEALAAKVVRKIFEVFNWNDPDPSMIQEQQQRLLTRNF